MNTAPPLIFGVYPFSLTGTPGGVAAGPPDDYARLPATLDALRGGRDLLLRAYVAYDGTEPSAEAALATAGAFARSPVPWDVALCFRSDDPDLSGWLRLIERIAASHGAALNSLQITNEPNLPHPPGDGARPHARLALAEGVVAARRAAPRPAVAVGFNAVPAARPGNNPGTGDDFWDSVSTFGPAFAAALDYVGVDLYPDVFGPRVAPEHLGATVAATLRAFRAAMTAAKLPPALPIRVTENGWPTPAGRDEAQQAANLETIVRAVHDLRAELNVTHYEWFGLRDANSAVDDLFHRFGLLRDDYTPKPAFDAYRRLIAELG